MFVVLRTQMEASFATLGLRRPLGELQSERLCTSHRCLGQLMLTLGAGQGLFLLGLLLLHLGEDRERQENLVARSAGWRQLPLGERSQVTVHLRFELGLIREPVRLD